MSNQQLSQEFLAILDGVAGDYTTAETMDDWMPDDADYTVVLTKGSFGHKAGDSSFAWFKVVGNIDAPQNPEVDKKSFTVAFATTKAMGAVKALASALAGRVVNNIREVPGIVEACAGLIVNVTVKTNQKGYKNVRIKEVIR